MYHLYLIPFAVAGIAVYMRARMKNDLRTVKFIQPFNTILAMAIAGLCLLTPHGNLGFTLWILAGLGLALVGDFLNIDMTDDRTVMVGLIIFVFAYLVYSAGLTVYNGFHREDIYAGVILALVLAGIMAYVWKGLGPMKLPVLVYSLNQVFMVSRAVSTFFGDTFSVTQAVLLTAGTVMLMAGDIEFAVHTFRKPLKISLGPILYSGGQLLMALSPGFFR